MVEEKKGGPLDTIRNFFQNTNSLMNKDQSTAGSPVNGGDNNLSNVLVNNKESSQCPVKQEKSSECPVNHSNNKNATNPFNMMEKPDQTKSKGQIRNLSTYRVTSSIPKGEFTPGHQDEKSALWMYPSEQQYFNAMKRKGWKPQEDDMPVIVAIHNAVNEQGWKKVIEWEKLHQDKPNPKLFRFMGRPKDISPKARILNWMGYSLPFDRHDWIIEREKEKIRYVIDFYSGPSKPGKPMSIYLDVRPALDTIPAVMDRMYMLWKQKINPLLPFQGNFIKETKKKPQSEILPDSPSSASTR